MRVDKTLSELWSLRACHSQDSFQELKEEASNTAFMAIGALQRLQEENERLQSVNSRYADRILKLKEQRKCLKSEYQGVARKYEKAENALKEVRELTFDTFLPIAYTQKIVKLVKKALVD